MCDRLQIHLICDEIYALSVFDSGEADAVHFTSALSLESGYDLFSKGLLHVEYGMAKVSSQSFFQPIYRPKKLFSERHD